MCSCDELEDRVTLASEGLTMEVTAVALADSRIERNGDVTTSDGLPNEQFAVICFMSASEAPSSETVVMVCC